MKELMVLIQDTKGGTYFTSHPVRPLSEEPKKKCYCDLDWKLFPLKSWVVTVEQAEVGLVYCAGRLSTSHWALRFSSPSSELLVTFHPSLSRFATSLMLLFLSPEHNTIKVYSEPLLSNTRGCLQYGALSWTLLLFMKEGKQWWYQKHSLFVCGCSPHHFPTAQILPGEYLLRGLNWDREGGGGGVGGDLSESVNCNKCWQRRDKSCHSLWFLMWFLICVKSQTEDVVFFGL